MTGDRIAGLVLAAGESRRMGANKALLEYRHRPFVRGILENLRRAGVRRNVVVLGWRADAIRKAMPLSDAQIIINRNFRFGQTSSLQCGLRALATYNATGALLCLIDHPAICPETFRRIVAVFIQTNAPVIIPIYRGRRGHPVLISGKLFPELLALHPHQAANAIVRNYRDKTAWVDVGDPGVLLDIDTPAEYQTLIRRK